jgi:hypothetical protein
MRRSQRFLSQVAEESVVVENNRTSPKLLPLDVSI